MYVAVGGGKPLKFGISEYALITRLNCGPYLKEKVPKNIRLVDKYLNNSSNVRSQELELAFAGCSDKEDAWKLGLVHFVDGVLYSYDANAKSIFLDLARGGFFLSNLLVQRALRGHLLDWMVHLQSLYLKSLEKRNAKKDGGPKYTAEAKYIVYGYAIIL